LVSVNRYNAVCRAVEEFGTTTLLRRTRILCRSCSCNYDITPCVVAVVCTTITTSHYVTIVVRRTTTTSLLFVVVRATTTTKSPLCVELAYRSLSSSSCPSSTTFHASWNIRHDALLLLFCLKGGIRLLNFKRGSSIIRGSIVQKF